MRTWLLVLGILVSGAVSAQHDHRHREPAHHAASDARGDAHAPYAGLHTRAIKALSPQQILDLRAGRGMSLALPAELNGYPGPAHVLELAHELDLNDVQIADTQRNFERMQETARTLGERVIAAETALDRLFTEGIVNRDNLDEATREAAMAHARLRAHHLRHHLDMMDLLTPEQVSAYNRLRGYD